MPEALHPVDNRDGNTLAEDDREAMIHELDALAAHLYGLSEPQLAHCFATFHRGWDYQG